MQWGNENLVYDCKLNSISQQDFLRINQDFLSTT